MSFEILCVFGTRPEAIKMAPIIKRLKTIKNIQTKVCITGQHRQMLDSILDSFEISPDFSLEVMTANQDLSSLTASIFTKLRNVYNKCMPNLVLVHGDTTTTLVASISAYYHHVPVAHIEAGLRTGDIWSPWPEEVNRKLTGALATLHFAPTETAKSNLLQEGVPESSIYVTGNTVIDALYEMIEKLNRDSSLNLYLHKKFHYLKPSRKMILVTCHRRESFGQGLERICQALATIAHLNSDIDIVYPVHLNPQVQQQVKSLLGAITNIYLIDPVDYLSFIYLMKSAYCILTDSGGIQEEAPSIGKPVLVMRDHTERPEAVDAGTVKVVGTDVKKIVSHVQELLMNENVYHQMSHVQSPYGDGRAAERIVQIIIQFAVDMKREQLCNNMNIGKESSVADFIC